MDEAFRPTNANDAAERTSQFGGEWPSPPGPREQQSGGWEADALADAASGADTDTALATDYAGFWPESPSEPWPAPVAIASGVDTREEVNVDQDVDGEDLAYPLSAEDDPERAANLRVQAHDLLDRLRDAIDSFDVGASLDLSGVISDLEVAVTPPGALPPDDVADLRDALLVARERPRDIDTIVDLTKRLEALVSLVIAYDRTIAAIERSLVALRRVDPSSPTTDRPSSPAMEEGQG